MKEFNADEVFEPIFDRIESGEIKTTYQLRGVLERLGEEFEVKALLMLEMFKKWLAGRYVELSTENGVVTISRI